MAKKMTSICALFLILLACFSGCAPKEDKEAIVGEWIWREVNGGQVNFIQYTFGEDGTVKYLQCFAGGMRYADYTYELSGGELILKSDLAADCSYDFSFNDNYTVLSLTIDGKAFTFSKNITK